MTEIHRKLVIVPMSRFNETPIARISTEVQNFIMAKMFVQDPKMIIRVGWQHERPGFKD